MPLTLPGLFDFTTGVNSGIAQQSNRAIASQNEALSFISQLNAFNTGLNTDDNLQFRQEFANQPQDTSILDRFTNIAGNTNNPFTLNQAVTQQQSLAPLLAGAAQQNPFFGAQQGIPTTPQGALQQGFLGFNPQFQQQANANILQTLAQNNPAFNANQLGNQAEQTQLTAIFAAQQAASQQALKDAQEQLRLERENSARVQKQQASNSPARTVNPNGATANNANSAFFFPNASRVTP